MNIDRERHFERTAPRFVGSGTSRRERGAEGLTQINLRYASDGPCFRNQALRAPLPLKADEAFRCASFGIEHEPTYVPVHFDQYTPTAVYAIDQRAWGRVLARDIDGVNDPRPLDDLTLGLIEHHPGAWRPKNPYYVKTHVNAPGTVRAWFRQMRAADFERDFSVAVGRGCGGVDILSVDEPPRWTLFDTQQVVGRETAEHYAIHSRWGILPVMSTDVLSRGVKVADLADKNPWFSSTVIITTTPAGPPSYIERLFRDVDADRRRAFLMGESDLEVELRRIDRAVYPAFSSKVPTSSRGITLDDLRRFVREDDERRPSRMTSIKPPDGY